MQWITRLALVIVMLQVATCATTALCQTNASVLALLQQHRFVEAEAAARESLLAPPQDCSKLTMLGLAERGQAKLDEAFQSFQRSNEVCPNNLASLEGAAEIAYGRRMPEAEGLLKEVVAVEPQNATAHAMLGAMEVNDRAENANQRSVRG